MDQAISGQKRGKVILLRHRIMMVAAAVALLIAGYFVLFMDQQPELPVIISEIDQSETGQDITDITPGSSKEPAQQTSPAGSGYTEALHLTEQQEITGRTDSKPNTSNPQKTEPYYLQVTQTPILISELISDESIEPYDPVIPTRLPVIPTYSYPGYIFTDAAIPDPQTSYRWTIAGLAGQTYSNYYEADGSRQALDGLYQQDVSSGTGEQITHPLVSYGLAVDYQITSRFGVSSGLGLHYFQTPMIQEVSGLTILSQKKPIANAFGSVSFNDAGIKSTLAKNPLIELYSGRLEQKFSYFEIPVTATYLIIDKQVGLSVKAGFGNNLLLENKVLFTDENISREMGYTEGLKSYYLSGILSLDLYLKFRNKWQANFSPVYRHALQPVSNDPMDPHTFSFGLYSGVKFRF